MFNPGHSRVYFKSSQKLAASEFSIVSQKLSAPVLKVEYKIIAGLEYFTFSVESILTPGDLDIVSGLSFVYALFELAAHDGAGCLLPIAKSDYCFVDEGISSILKYTGKTNELFTRMLINVAYYSQDCANEAAYGSQDGLQDGAREVVYGSLDGANEAAYGSLDSMREVRLLDPVAGKGTTLYEGLIKGFNVYGVEIGDKVVTEAYHFMKKFLETGKYKHKSGIQKVSGVNKSFTANRYTFEIARSKAGQKSNDVRVFEIIAGNSVHAGVFYKRGFFDMIVGDLPYGVQHGSVTNQKQGPLTRNPSELLGACLGAWADVLKPGGAMVLSWNKNVLARGGVEALLGGCGLEVLDGPAYRGFEHRVDQSIVRDVAAAKKPRG